jgi:hypothetical protein
VCLKTNPLFNQGDLVSDPIQLAPYQSPPEPSDADKAKYYRDQLRPLLQACADILNDAGHSGIVIGFNVPRDQFGRHVVGEITVTRPL